MRLESWLLYEVLFFAGCWSRASALLAKNCSNCMLGVLDCSLSPSHCSISFTSFTSSFGPFFYSGKRCFTTKELSDNQQMVTCVGATVATGSSDNRSDAAEVEGTAVELPVLDRN